MDMGTDTDHRHRPPTTERSEAVPELREKGRKRKSKPKRAIYCVMPVVPLATRYSAKFLGANNVQRCTGALVGALVGAVGECCWWVLLVGLLVELLVGALVWGCWWVPWWVLRWGYSCGAVGGCVGASAGASVGVVGALLGASVGVVSALVGALVGVVGASVCASVTGPEPVVFLTTCSGSWGGSRGGLGSRKTP